MTWLLTPFWFWALFWVAYVLIGIGTARWVFAVRMERQVAMYLREGRTRAYALREAYSDPETSLPALFGGLFWPLTIALVVPIKLVGPLIGRWFLAPTRKRLEVKS